jgi:hypothetical protein
VIGDGLRSTLALTDENGTLQTDYVYEPFGSTTVSGASSVSPTSFAGRERSLPDDPAWATPLAWAKKRGHEEIARLLQQQSASGGSDA